MATKITMKEIARRVNVSVATASRVINQPHLVAEETRELVLAAMREHDYVYNAVAGSFSRKHSTTIGVIIPTTENQAFASTVMAIQAECMDHNYAVMVYSSHFDPEAEDRILRQFLERQLEGVIITARDKSQSALARLLMGHGIACVFLWEVMKEPELSFVGFDNFQAGARVAAHLLDLGHRRIGLMAGLFSKVDRVAHRVAGCRQAFEDRGLRWNPDLVLELDPSLAAGREGVKRLMKGPARTRPTAVLTLSDTLALGARAGLDDLGLRVPEDVSLSGFDGLELTAYTLPPLTTLHVPAEEIGRQAVRTLFNLIGNKDGGPIRLQLETELVVRASTRAVEAAPEGRRKKMKQEERP